VHTTCIYGTFTALITVHTTCIIRHLHSANYITVLDIFDYCNDVCLETYHLSSSRNLNDLDFLDFLLFFLIFSPFGNSTRLEYELNKTSAVPSITGGCNCNYTIKTLTCLTLGCHPIKDRWLWLDYKAQTKSNNISKVLFIVFYYIRYFILVSTKLGMST
jgi:hypothetical protein